MRRRVEGDAHHSGHLRHWASTETEPANRRRERTRQPRATATACTAGSSDRSTTRRQDRGPRKSSRGARWGMRARRDLLGGHCDTVATLARRGKAAALTTSRSERAQATIGGVGAVCRNRSGRNIAVKVITTT